MVQVATTYNPPVPVQRDLESVTLTLTPYEAAALLVVSHRIGGLGSARRFFSPRLSEALSAIPEVECLSHDIRVDPQYDAIYFEE